MRRIDNGTCPMDMRCRECGEKIKPGEPIAQYEDAPLEYYEHATCADRRAEAFDTYHCRSHGTRYLSRGELRQEERDETCVYVCTLCGQVADPTPLF